jgi:hypothetical protein
MQELPEPLVPAEVDLTDFAFMPLEVGRLLNSEWWIVACVEDPRRAVAAVNLWAASWHQRPAASLPSNPIVLAKLAMVDPSTWHQITDSVLAAWVLCSDGRIYHPVVAEKALEAWERKQEAAGKRDEHRERMRRWREAKAEKSRNRGGDRSRDDAVTITEQSREPLRDGSVTSLTGTGTETEEERDKSLLSNAAALDQPEKAVKEPKEGYTAEFEEWWKAYPRKDSKGAAFRAYKAAKRRATPERLIEGAKAYAAQRKGQDPKYTKQPATWLNADGWNDETSGPPTKAGHIVGYTPLVF